MRKLLCDDLYLEKRKKKKKRKESYTGVYIFPNSADVYLMFVHLLKVNFA